MMRNLTSVSLLAILLTACLTPPEKPAPTTSKVEKQPRAPETQARSAGAEQTDAAGQSTQTSADRNVALSVPHDRALPESADRSSSANTSKPPPDGGSSPGRGRPGNVDAQDHDPPARPGQPGNADPSSSADVSKPPPAGGSQPGSGQANAKDNELPTRPGEALTDAEEITAIERELDRQLSEFDAILLRRQGQIKARQNEQGGGGRQAGGDEYLDGDVADPQAADGTGQTAASGDKKTKAVTAGRQPGDSGDNRAGEFEDQASPEDLPEDVADGKDDDVVARQLREAAMRETDPVLREKLWDEYRKYKRGVQSKR